MDTERPPPEAGGPRRRVLAAMAGELASPAFPRGDLAGLRRMDPDAPGGAPVFLKLLARHHPDALAGADEDGLRRWALVLHGMALLAPDHHRGRRAGDALSDAGYAESRLARLLNARGAQFRALVPRLCRHVKSRDQRLDWSELALLVLDEGRDEEWAERRRLAIARAYYQREAAAAKKSDGKDGDDAE